MSKEIWAPVQGEAGRYEVSSLGRVRSVPRLVPSGRGRSRFDAGRVLRQHVGNGGYLNVSLGRSRRRVRVHVLVLEAFAGPRPAGAVCRHMDGDPANNTADNLSWGTQSENILDAVRQGRHVRAGSRNNRAVLNESSVRLMRTIYALGDTTYAEIGAAFGVGPEGARSAIRLRTWTHV